MNDLNNKNSESTSDKKITKVVSGQTKTRTNEKRKLVNMFISEDVGNLKSYVFMDVLIPSIKEVISDIIVNGTRMILFGETASRRKEGPANKISYREYYDNRDRDRRNETRRSLNSSSKFDYNDLVFDSRIDAEEVLEQMDYIIKRYGLVTVADMYEMAGIIAPHTSNKYGWTSVVKAEIHRVRDGFVIDLPKAMPID